MERFLDEGFVGECGTGKRERVGVWYVWYVWCILCSVVVDGGCLVGQKTTRFGTSREFVFLRRLEFDGSVALCKQLSARTSRSTEQQRQLGTILTSILTLPYQSRLPRPHPSPTPTSLLSARSLFANLYHE